MTKRIYYTKPSITELEVEYATDAARNGWGEHCYDYISRFENLFREHLGVKYAIATSSCTGALHMGLAALGIGLSNKILEPLIGGTGGAIYAKVLILVAVILFLQRKPSGLFPAKGRAADMS